MKKNIKKIISIILAAVLFGGIAGTTMVGINYLAESKTGSLLGNSKTIESIEEETAPEKSSGSAQSNGNENAGAGNSGSKSVQAGGSSSGGSSAQTNSGNFVLPDVSGIVEEAMPSLVSITNTMVVKQQSYGSIFDFFYGGGITEQEYEVPASGSGVILKETDDEYLIVTNNHVIEDYKKLTVQFIDGETAQAALKGADESVDIAIIAVEKSDVKEETREKLSVATLHAEEDIKPGQGCIAIGNALGYGQTVTVGYISALNREITTAENGKQTDLIQTDAAINPGNSGGALLNMNGEVIGINVAKNAKSTVDSVGFSIPIYKVMDIITELSEAKTKIPVAEGEQARLGVYLSTVDEQQAAALNMPAGIMVTGFSDEVIEGREDLGTAPSPAKEAGLLKGDIITKFDGQSVGTSQELSELVKYYEAGSTVDITIKRLYNGDYSEKIITVTLGSVNDMPNMSDSNEPKDDGTSGRSKAGSNGNDGNSGNGGDAPDAGGRNNGGNGFDRFFGNGSQNDGSGNGSGNGSDDGSNGNGNSEEPRDDGSTGRNNDDVYDLFRQFMEQYR